MDLGSDLLSLAGGTGRACAYDWALGDNIRYAESQLIIYTGKLYRTKKRIPSTTSTGTPDVDLDNYELLGAGGGGSTGIIKFDPFKPSNKYQEGECIYYNNSLLASKNDFTSGANFNIEDWYIIADMVRSDYDKNSNIIVDDAEHSKLSDLSTETMRIRMWKEYTDYKAYDNLIYDYKFYIVSNDFTSGDTFDNTNLIQVGISNHDDLKNISGGDSNSNEYYHLAKNKYDIIEKLSESNNKLAFSGQLLGDMLSSNFDKDGNGIVDKADEAKTLEGLVSTIDELNFLQGVTSSIQQQIDNIASGGAGIKDLSAFKTSDLADSPNFRYVTDQEKTNLQNLTSIVSTQTSMNNTLNKIQSAMPSNISSTNPLATISDLTAKLSTLKFTSLADVDKNIKANSFVVVDSTGTKITYLDKLSAKIQKVTDKSDLVYTDVPYLKFRDMKAFKATDGTLELTTDILSTNLKDMPSAIDGNKVLVSDQSSQSYRLESISDLTNSKANFTTMIDQDDWTMDEILGLYTAFVPHTLKSTDLIIGTYNTFGDSLDTVSWKVTDIDKVLFKSKTNDTTKVVLNCSQGVAGNGTGSGGSSLVSATDFLDDTRLRDDKTYSSQKIFDTYVLKDAVYTKDESDAIYSSKTLEHIHNNIDCINLLSKDDDGNLYFGDERVLTSTLKAFTYQDHWDNQEFASATLLVNVNEIFNTKSYSAILNTEFTIKNNIAVVDEVTDAKPENQLHLTVIDSSLAVVDVLIPPGSTQKYILGISPNVQIMITGKFSANYYLTAY